MAVCVLFVHWMLFCDWHICMSCLLAAFLGNAKIISEYDHEIPQSQTSNLPWAPQGRATQ